MADLDVGSIATIVSFILIGGGLVAILLPVAPSIPTVWFGIFVYAISHDFVAVDQTFMTVITAIAAVTIGLDYALSKSGAQKIRAGGWGIMGAVLGFIGGSFAGPIWGYLVGPVVGAIAAEQLRGRDQAFAYKAGKYTVVAFMGGTIIKLVASLVMIGLFVLRLQGKL